MSFSKGQKVVVLISELETEIVDVLYTQNGVRYTLQGRSKDLHYSENDLMDLSQFRVQKWQREAQKEREQVAETKRRAEVAHSTDNGSQMLATSVLMQPYLDTDTGSSCTSRGSHGGYDSSSSSSYDSYSSSDSGSSSSSSSCD